MDIFIWGCNDFSKQLLRHLHQSPVNVLGFISENSAEKNFCSKPVYLPQHIQQNFPATPIVIAIPYVMLVGLPIIRMKSIQQFKERIQEISKEYALPNQLLHPAALVDSLPLTFKKKIILFGLQGSGNVIFSHLFQDLQKYFLPFFIWRSKRTLFFELLCREYRHLLYQVVTESIHLQSGYDIRAVTWKLGSSHFNCKLANRQEGSVYLFPTREHIALSTPMYHQLPSQTLIKKLIADQFTLFFIMRNPLDMILSGLNKANAVNAETKTIDTAMFEGSALWITKQLSAWAPLLNHFKVLKYEELLAHPEQTIKTLMRQLRLPAFSWLARKLWKRHAFKQLPNTFKNHFWQGGAGKWRQYFSAEHLAFLKACGIEDVLAAYHYSEVLEVFQHLTKDIDGAQLKTLQIDINTRTPCWYGDETVDTYDFLTKQHGAERCIHNPPFIVMSHDDEARGMLDRIFCNPYLRLITDAGVV